MNEQVEVWSGGFGNEYTDRNNIPWLEHYQFFEGLLVNRRPLNTLEVGCNQGHNLEALQVLLGSEHRGIGVDVNQHALDIAEAKGLEVYLGDGITLPFRDERFDLVFTKGVLIHISPDNLHDMMREIYRVSNRYILFIEYFGNEETPIEYRGHDNLLWKRDFLRDYLTLFPNLRILNQKQWFYGEHLQERTDGVLLEKGETHDTIRQADNRG